MDKIEHNILLSQGRHPILTLFIILLLAFSGFQAIGPIIGFVFTLPFFDFDAINALESITDPVGREGVKVPIFIMQGLATLIGFIIIPLIYLKIVIKIPFSSFFSIESFKTYPVFLLTIIVLSFMFLNTIFIEWNANIQFPEWLSSWENTLKFLEDAAKKQTEFLTSFDNTGQFILAFLVIAVIPAIGEEFLFRGFVQNLLKTVTGNVHAAIWIAAFIFSAFHLQFYGLVPRMMLGVLFGYLYVWSGNLGTAMLAHFINNGFMLIMMYLYQKNVTNLDMEKEASLPLLFLIVLFLNLTAVIYLYRKYFKKHNANQ